MRILVSLALAVCILAGTKVYLAANQPEAADRIESIDKVAEGLFAIELVPLFDAGPDEFALDASNASSIVVEFRGEQLLNQKEAAANGQAIVIEDVKGLVQGENELYVKATPTDEASTLIRGLRVRVLRNKLLLAEEWISSEPGAPVEGAVLLVLGAFESSEHKHEP